MKGSDECACERLLLSASLQHACLIGGAANRRDRDRERKSRPRELLMKGWARQRTSERLLLSVSLHPQALEPMLGDDVLEELVN